YTLTSEDMKPEASEAYPLISFSENIFHELTKDPSLRDDTDHISDISEEEQQPHSLLGETTGKTAMICCSHFLSFVTRPPNAPFGRRAEMLAQAEKAATSRCHLGIN
ncbi:hypothetical protein STEG23_016752, partial [Scotinomys teguina]